MKTDLQATAIRSVRIAALVVLACVLAGCKTYPVNVKRGPMPEPSSHRNGRVSVADFKDTRAVTNKSSIGKVLTVDFVVEGGTPIERVMQSHFQAALQHVGYEIAPAQEAPVRIEGEVFLWHLEKQFGGEFECRIGVKVRVCEPVSGKVLWEHDIDGAENDLLSRDNAARAAVDVTLAKAIREFSSTDFFQAVQRRD